MGPTCSSRLTRRSRKNVRKSVVEEYFLSRDQVLLQRPCLRASRAPPPYYPQLAPWVRKRRLFVAPACRTAARLRKRVGVLPRGFVGPNSGIQGVLHRAGRAGRRGQAPVARRCRDQDRAGVECAGGFRWERLTHEKREWRGAGEISPLSPKWERVQHRLWP